MSKETLGDDNQPVEEVPGEAKDEMARAAAEGMLAQMPLLAHDAGGGEVIVTIEPLPAVPSDPEEGPDGPDLAA